IYPTLCEIVGLPIAEHIDGRSAFKILNLNQTKKTMPFTIWVRKEGGFYGGLTYYAAREGDFKLVQNTPFEPFQFFNIAKDPFETNPLELSESDIGKNLRQKLRWHIIKSGSVKWQR
ncbi:MAG: N-acetylgalactosamine 6-sulfate sulfatase, partial [Cyclobacteriaceae bacterium]